MKESNNGQTIKAVMAEIRRLDKKISLLQDEIAMLKSSCIPGGISYDRDRVQTSPTADRLGEVFSKIEEKTDLLTFEMMEAVNRKADLLESINRMSDIDEMMALYYRYVEGVKYEDLPDSLGWSARQTARILKRAEAHFRYLPPSDRAGEADFLRQGDRDDYYDDMIQGALILA